MVEQEQITPLATLLTRDGTQFVSRILHQLKGLDDGIKEPILNPQFLMALFPIDHICFRVATWEEYQYRKQELVTLGSQLLIETDIGGRPISTFLLPKELTLKVPDPDWVGCSWDVIGEDGKQNLDSREGRWAFGSHGTREIRVLEVPAPKPGADYPSGFEHIEFAVGDLKSDFLINDFTVASIHDREAVCEQKRLDQARLVLRELLPKITSPWHKYIDLKGMNKKEFNIDVRIEMPAPSKVTANLYNFDSRAKSCIKYHWLPLERVIEIEKNKRRD